MTKKRKSAFKGKVAHNAHEQKNRSSSYGYLNLPNGVGVYKHPEGRAKIDILPYEVTDEHHMDRNDENEIALVGDLWYKKPFKVHRNIGSSNESVICLNTIGKKCPICEYRKQLMASGATKEETDPLKPTLRNLYVVIPLGSKEFDEKPHIWDISQHLFQTLLNEELEEDPDYEIFPDIEEGMSLKIRSEERSLGKSKNTFNEVKRIDFEDREESYTEDILEDVPNLDEVLTIYTYEQLERLFMEDEMPEEEAPEEAPKEEEIPIRKKQKVNNEEEEDEEEKPKRKKKSIKEEVPEEEEILKTRKKGMMVRDREREEEKTSTKTSRKSSKKSLQEDEEECPEGYEFGEDTDMYDECEDCPLWDACDNANTNK